VHSHVWLRLIFLGLWSYIVTIREAYIFETIFVNIRNSSICAQRFGSAYESYFYIYLRRVKNHFLVSNVVLFENSVVCFYDNAVTVA
jgi:hypothetical protein